MKYPSIFHLISSVASEKSANIVLIGGFAVNYYGVSRQTIDVDFLTTNEDFKKIVGLIEKEGYKKDCSQDIFVRLRTDTDYLLDLDFMFVDKETLSKIIKEGKEIDVARQKFIIPSLMHLIALKLHSIKNNPERIAKDLMDIIEMVKINKIDVISKDFKDLCLEYGTESLYNDILDKSKT
ncbi:MAG: hypothetical protein R6U54_04740 [Candidatus Omnitrophota bacterium]